VVVSTGLMFGIISFYHILSADEINDDEVVTPCKTRGKWIHVYWLLVKKRSNRARWLEVTLRLSWKV